MPPLCYTERRACAAQGRRRLFCRLNGRNGGKNGRSKRKGATRRYGRPCVIAPWTIGSAPLLCGRPVARSRLEKDLAMARRVRYHSFQEALAHTAACGPGRWRCRFCVTGMWTGLSRRRVPVGVAPRDRPRSAGPDASDAGDGMNERRGMRDRIGTTCNLLRQNHRTPF